MTSGSLAGDLEGRLDLYDNPYLLVVNTGA